jgi:tripartite-type tricarboxylate transporter receptor subunit TctC
VLIGYAPAGSADAGVRPLARALEPLLGQPRIIENRPGNAGGVAMEFMVRAQADGYTLYYFDSGPLTVAPHLAKVGYNNFTSQGEIDELLGALDVAKGAEHMSSFANLYIEMIAEAPDYPAAA